jgi:hypothetical protein
MAGWSDVMDRSRKKVPGGVAEQSSSCKFYNKMLIPRNNEKWRPFGCFVAAFAAGRRFNGHGEVRRDDS